MPSSAQPTAPCTPPRDVVPDKTDQARNRQKLGSRGGGPGYFDPAQGLQDS